MTILWRTISLAILLTLTALPIYLLMVGVDGGLVAIAVISSCPGAVMVAYTSMRDRTWPVITGGPGIVWAEDRSRRR